MNFYLIQLCTEKYNRFELHASPLKCTVDFELVIYNTIQIV